MSSKSMALRLLSAALLVVLALAGLDVVDSARTVVVLGGYLWCVLLVAAALVVAFRTLRSRHAH